MRVVRLDRFGGPDVLRVVDAPVPEVGVDEVLIAVEAAAVNRLDVLTRSGGYHRGGPPPLVLGNEGSGTIAAVGARVTAFAVGDPVFAFRGRPGFYAERVAVPATRVVGRPAGLSPAAAAALPTAWLSAWYCLHHLAGVQPGEVVLVYAASSGVGDAATQIARRAGATVIAVAGSDDKVAWALRNGAHHGIDRARQDVHGQVMAATGGTGADVVLDTVGGVTFAESLRVAARRGRVVALANVALEPSTIDTRDFYPRNVTIYGFQIADLIESGYDPRDDLRQLADLVAAGMLSVHIDATLPFEQAAQAHQRLEQRQARGKVVLVPTPPPPTSPRSAS